MSTNLNDPALVDVMEAVRRLSTNDQLLIASNILQAAVAEPAEKVTSELTPVDERPSLNSAEHEKADREELSRQQALSKFIEEWGPLGLDGDEIVQSRTISDRQYDF